MLSIQSLCHFDEGVGMDKVLYHIFSWKIANMSAVLKVASKREGDILKVARKSFNNVVASIQFMNRERCE